MSDGIKFSETPEIPQETGEISEARQALDQATHEAETKVEMGDIQEAEETQKAFEDAISAAVESSISDLTGETPETPIPAGEDFQASSGNDLKQMIAPFQNNLGALRQMVADHSQDDTSAQEDLSRFGTEEGQEGRDANPAAQPAEISLSAFDDLGEGGIMIEEADYIDSQMDEQSDPGDQLKEVLTDDGFELEDTEGTQKDGFLEEYQDSDLIEPDDQSNPESIGTWPTTKSDSDDGETGAETDSPPPSAPTPSDGSDPVNPSYNPVQGVSGPGSQQPTSEYSAEMSSSQPGELRGFADGDGTAAYEFKGDGEIGFSEIADGISERQNLGEDAEELAREAPPELNSTDPVPGSDAPPPAEDDPSLNPDERPFEETVQSNVHFSTDSSLDSQRALGILGAPNTGLDIDDDDGDGSDSDAPPPVDETSSDSGVSPNLPSSDAPGENPADVQVDLAGTVQEGADSSLSIDTNALIQSALREAYLENMEDLTFYADKVKYFNACKKMVRSYITELRDQQTSIQTTAGEAQFSDAAAVNQLSTGEFQALIDYIDNQELPGEIQVQDQLADGSVEDWLPGAAGHSTLAEFLKLQIEDPNNNQNLDQYSENFDDIDVRELNSELVSNLKITLDVLEEDLVLLEEKLEDFQNHPEGYQSNQMFTVHIPIKNPDGSYHLMEMPVPLNEEALENFISNIQQQISSIEGELAVLESEDDNDDVGDIYHEAHL